ncbi:23944_t:CDS:1, partial [Racocetra persica]
EVEDIVKATRGLARTSLAQIMINCSNEDSESEIEDVEQNNKKRFKNQKKAR